MTRIVWGVSFMTLALVLRLIAPHVPRMVEKYFARGFYPHFANVLTKINRLVPISIFEYSLLALVVLLVLWLAGAILCGIFRSDVLPSYWKNTFSSLVLIAGILSLWYMAGGGLNYFRLTFAQYSGLELQKSTAQELAEMCTDLAAEAERLAPGVARDENGCMVLQNDFDTTCRSTLAGYDALAGEYDGVLARGSSIRPKAVDLSAAMSLARFTGLFSFYTGEANINTDIPAYTIPSTVAHETAHSCGFMREDEANYIAFLACRASGDAEAEYSGTMLALIHSLNALYRTDRELWRPIRASLSHDVDRDFDLNNVYWKNFTTEVGRVSEKFNDTHLKLNNQQDGTRSYGRMVDLLLADWRDGGF